MKSVAWVVGVAVVMQASARAQPHWTERIAFKGDLRLRYETIDEQGEADRNRGRYRARLSASAQVTDDIELVFELASGADDPVSRNQTFDGGFTTKDFGLDLAYVNWQVNDNVNLYGGKMKNPLFRPGSIPLIWDNDLNPEGVALGYASDRFFGTVASFSVEERSSSGDSLLVAAQGGMKFNLTEAAKLTVGFGYYDYTNTVGNEPFYDGSANGNSVDSQGNLVFDYDEVEFYAQYETRVGGLPLTVIADFVRNSEVDLNDSAYSLGLRAGKAKDPGSWEAFWAYLDIEADAVIGTFNDSDFGGGGTDATGHMLGAKYAVHKNVSLGANLFINEVEKNAGNQHDYSRLQLDVEFKFE